LKRNVDARLPRDKKAPESARTRSPAHMTEIRPNVFDANCGSREVLSIVTHRWAMLTMYALGAFTLRHHELKAKIGGITQKMLTQTLRELERDGLVARTDHGEMPPRVDYALTPLGLTLLDTLGAICSWSEQHLAEVREARRMSGHDVV
jgi:DNA-binding HxlR family transcriptional regulator